MNQIGEQTGMRFKLLPNVLDVKVRSGFFLLHKLLFRVVIYPVQAPVEIVVTEAPEKMIKSLV